MLLVASTLRTASWSGVPLGADPTGAPIDANGNLTQKVEGSDNWTYEWNAEGQLKRVLLNGNEVARFSYDPKGRRVEKVASGVTTSYLYDRSAILREVRGGATFRYLQGPGIDRPLAREDGPGALTYFHADGLGSIVKRTSQAGAVVHEYRYDAWGNPEAGASEPGYAFTGREWDPETGLYYYRARYYDPKVGRFVSEDPIEFDAGVNFFAYVQNNPVHLTDPLGTKPGDKFATVQEAAIDALTTYFCRSIAEDKEYCFRLYQNPDKTYSSTPGRPGEAHSCDPPPVPGGNTDAGWAHTHGAASPGYKDEEVSDNDFLTSAWLDANGFLATPSGRILEFNPHAWAAGDAGAVRQIGSIDPCACK